MMAADGWIRNGRIPAAFRAIICLGADGREYPGLCYSPYRREIIEPITNKSAEPVIGPIQGWQYMEDCK